MTNNGAADAANVAIVDPLPTHTTYIDGSADSGGLRNGDQIEWTIPTIAANGGSATVSFQVVIDNPLDPTVQEIANRGTVNGQLTCDDLVTCEPTTIPTVNLSNIKTVTDADGDGVAEAGEVLTYQIVVTNHGGGSADNVPVQDRAPANTTYVASSTKVNGIAAGDIDGGITIPTILANGGQGVVEFQVTVNAPIPDGVTMIAN